MQKPLRLAYIFLAYPSLHKTFVDREIVALRKLGVQVKIYALHEPHGLLSPYQQEIKKEVIYLGRNSFRQRVKANLRFFLRWPWRYTCALVSLLTQPHPAYHPRKRTLYYFFHSVLLASLVQKDLPDHIHAHFLNESVTAAMLASRFLGIPYSATVHASNELFVFPRMIREKLAGARFVATCTAFNRDYLARITRGLFDQRQGPKALVIYHGLDGSQFRRKAPPAAGTPIILSVGQLQRRKGYPVLLEACALLQRRGVYFTCRIVGDGEQRQALEQQIARLQIGDRVQLCGAMSQEEVIRQYEAASIFTLPVIVAPDGDRDGIPNVLLEAMAMELPVVSSNHTAIPEVIQDGENGLLVPPEDPEALAGALERLLAEPELRQHLGRRGRESVLMQFDPQRNAQLLLDAFMLSAV